MPDTAEPKQMSGNALGDEPLRCRRPAFGLAAGESPVVARIIDGNAMQDFSAAEQALIEVWEAHTAAEFEAKDADAAIATMTENPVLVHVPVGTGATGREALRRFYKEIFIPQMPMDVEVQLLTRTVGQNRVIDEFVLRMTHSVQMDWFAPGVPPTGRRLIVPTVGIVAFEDGKIGSEHIFWDQGSVLLQLGILEEGLPALGAAQADRLLNAGAPANELIGKLS